MRFKVRHNAEIAHRLSLTEGKCLQIHGHSLQIELVMLGLNASHKGMAVNNYGDEMDFTAVKKKFRHHIDTTYDHHLLLNQSDPWAQTFYLYDTLNDDPVNGKQLPGLVAVNGDPTIENLCMWMAIWSATTFRTDCIIRIEETKTNGAEVMAHWDSFTAKVVQ